MCKPAVYLLFAFLLVGCSVFAPAATPGGTPAPTTNTFITETPISKVTIVPDTGTNPISGDDQFQATIVADPSIANPQLPALPELDQSQPIESGLVDAPFRYLVQPGTPLALPSPLHPGCDWMGVGGQIFDENDQPDTSVIVLLGGKLGEAELSLATMAGWSPHWGPSGFEMMLAAQPAASQSTLWLELYNPEWQPVSRRIYFDTYAECEKNFVMINFNKKAALKPGFWLYMPEIFRDAMIP